eukprot:768782-Hanusia_phi.AAC.16
MQHAHRGTQGAGGAGARKLARIFLLLLLVDISFGFRFHAAKLGLQPPRCRCLPIRRIAPRTCKTRLEMQAVTDERAEFEGARTMEEGMKMLGKLEKSESWSKDDVVRTLDSLKAGAHLSMWDSVPSLYRRVSVGEVRLLTRGLVKEGTFDLSGNNDLEILNVSFYTTLLSSMLLSTLAACFIPEYPNLPFLQGDLLRYVVTFSLGSLPFAFLGMGLSVPGLLQLALIQIRRTVSAEYRERLLWHEAGHFLVGYCLGLPIAAYSADDPILNAVQFFDSEEEAISHEFLDILCAVSTAGVVAEAIRFGDAIGGYADFSQLQSFLNRARPRLNDKEQQERVRWGCVAAFTILKNREQSLEALIKAMSAKSSISQCILAIESHKSQDRK